MEPGEINIKEVEPLLIGADVCGQILGISRRHFAQLEADGMVGPMPLRLGRRRVWNLLEIKEWVRQKCPTREEYLKARVEHNE